MEQSSFGWTALISGIIGALSTQCFVLLKELYSQKVQQIRGINGAIIASATICDGLLQVNLQHLGKLKRLIDEENERLDKALEDHHLHGKSLIFESQITFLTITKTDLPIGHLTDLLQSKVNAKGHDLLYLYGITQNYHLFLNALSRYNELVVELSEKSQAVEAEEMIFRVAGRAMKDGSVDSRYVDCLNQLLVAIDHGAALSVLLCESLRKSGKKISNSFVYRKPKICSVDFPKLKQGGVFPTKATLDKFRIPEVNE